MSASKDKTPGGGDRTGAKKSTSNKADSTIVRQRINGISCKQFMAMSLQKRARLVRDWTQEARDLLEHSGPLHRLKGRELLKRLASWSDAIREGGA